jgi:hypothetical protein
MTATADGREALDELYWRDEILQAMFWMRGEGLAEAVTAVELARFLAADEATVASHVERLAADGYLARAGERESGRAGEGFPAAYCPLPSAYCLTALGLEEGGRSFHDEFADYLRQAHGECGPGCWCKDPEHAGEQCPNEPKQEPEHARG